MSSVSSAFKLIMLRIMFIAVVLRLQCKEIKNFVYTIIGYQLTVKEQKDKINSDEQVFKLWHK